MLTVLDTNTLIRFFTNDIPEKAQKVKALLQTEKNLAIPDAVFPELEYTLDKQYNLPKGRILEVFQFLASQKNIKTSQQVKKAIKIFENTKLDMADCIIASFSLKGALASFDRDLLHVENVTSFWQ